MKGKLIIDVTLVRDDDGDIEAQIEVADAEHRASVHAMLVQGEEYEHERFEHIAPERRDEQQGVA